MIITRTPFRVSFFGGGTDYPEWYREEGGEVLSTTINKYCYISAKWLLPFFGIKHRVVWSHVETVFSIEEILHPSVRATLSYLGFTDETGIEIHHQGDLPARAGMGSSSAFVVGLVHALKRLRGEYTDRRGLAEAAITVEQDILGESVGCQDQMAAAYGGLNHIKFHQDGSIDVNPVYEKSRGSLESKLMLFYIGTTRTASDIAKDIVGKMGSKKDIYREMSRNVTEAIRILSEGTSALSDFGRLMHENWLLKRQQSPLVATQIVDVAYDKARRNGALGGKLLGAGGTGFMLFYVPEGKQDRVRKALAGFVHVPFRFENSGSVAMLDERNNEDRYAS